MEKLVYNVNDLTKVLDIGLNKAYELVRENKIPNIRVGKKYMIPRKELLKWLKKSEI
ncbi:MAG: helix-turn-helix domain-containing protein [Clostridiales bacterium]